MIALRDDPALEAFLDALPKTETHLHIEGALPFRFVREAYPERYDRVPASWAPDFKFRSFAHFETELLEMVAAWHHSPERYHLSASEIFDRLQREQGVKYVECSFASGVIEFIGGDGAATAEAIKAAAPDGLEVRVFMGLHHDGYHAGTRPWIDQAVGWEHLDGIDLHGPEDTPVGSWAADLWARFRAAGKRTKAHAGEFQGPAFVTWVVETLGVERVQHGVRAVEDPALPAWLAERGIILDVCPISNVKLNVVPTMAAHPLRRLLAAGVLCTVSTDDPISFGNTLKDEYRALAAGLDFNFAELAQLARNGFLTADLPAGVRRHWVAEVDRVLAAHG
jgi:adenine deaminase